MARDDGRGFCRYDQTLSHLKNRSGWHETQHSRRGWSTLRALFPSNTSSIMQFQRVYLQKTTDISFDGRKVPDRRLPEGT